MSENPEHGTLVRLRRILVARLEDIDLRSICHDLQDVDYENLSGDAKPDKVLSLMSYLEKRERVPDLIRVGKEVRPDIPWEHPPEEEREQAPLEGSMPLDTRAAQVQGKDEPDQNIEVSGTGAAASGGSVAAGAGGAAIGGNVQGPVVIAQTGAQVFLQAPGAVADHIVDSEERGTSARSSAAAEVVSVRDSPSSAVVSPLTSLPLSGLNYELGLDRMRKLIADQAPAMLDEFFVLEARMRENLRASRLYGEDQTTRSDRFRVVASLNAVAQQVGVSFNDLCRG